MTVEYAIWIAGSIVMGALAILTYLARAHKGGRCLDGNDVIRGLVAAAVLFSFSIISIVYTDPAERGPILDHVITLGFGAYAIFMAWGYRNAIKGVRKAVR